MGDSRIAVVTGASSGIGAAIATRLAARGDRVALLSRDERALEEVAAGLATAGAAIRADVRDPRSLAEAAMKVESALGVPELLILAAGFGRIGRFDTISPEDYETMFGTNVLGLIETVRVFLPSLIESRGTIVAISSIGGRLAAPSMAGYCATKFAVHGFLDGLRFELAGTGVGVVEVCPGQVNTGLFGSDDWLSKLPRGARMLPTLDPDQVARATLKAADRGRNRVTLPWLGAALARFNDVVPEVSRVVQGWIEGQFPAGRFR